VHVVKDADANAAKGTASVSGPLDFSFAAAAGAGTTDTSFTFHGVNQSGLSSPLATQVVHIDPTFNRAPSNCFATTTTIKDTPATITPSCLDADGDPVTFSVAQNAQ